MTRCWLLKKSESHSHNRQLAADLVSAATFKYRALGRGNDVRISKVGKSLANNPAFRHQARSSSRWTEIRDWLFSLTFRRPFLPTWVLPPLDFYSRHVCSEKNCSRALCPVLVLHARLPRPVPPSLALSLSFFASCAGIRSWRPAWWIVLLDEALFLLAREYTFIVSYANSLAKLLNSVSSP